MDPAVTGLKPYNVVPGDICNRGILVKPTLRLPVELLHVGNRYALQGRDDVRPSLVALEPPVQAGRQHPELGAPVADVVLADDVVAEELERPADGVADDRAAEVPDVHLLGEVGMGVIDDDGLAFGRFGQAEALVGQAARQLVGEPAPLQADVDEAGPGDVGALGEVGEVGGLDGPGGELARVGAEGLGGGHGAVGLVVAEFRPGGRGDGARAACRGAGGGQGRGDALLQFGSQVHRVRPGGGAGRGTVRRRSAALGGARRRSALDHAGPRRGPQAARKRAR